MTISKSKKLKKGAAQAYISAMKAKFRDLELEVLPDEPPYADIGVHLHIPPALEARREDVLDESAHQTHRLAAESRVYVLPTITPELSEEAPDG